MLSELNNNNLQKLKKRLNADILSRIERLEEVKDRLAELYRGRILSHSEIELLREIHIEIYRLEQRLLRI
jgi:hypothetical protein